MKGLLLSLLASATMTPNHPAGPAAPLREIAQPNPAVSEWSFTGQADQTCELQTDGAVTDAAGADLSLLCAENAQVLGNVMARLPAQSWRQRRVTISVEMQAADAMSASLWLKTLQGATTLMFDDDTEQNLLSTAVTADGWVRRSITLPVAANATQISFGVLLQGGGTFALRAVQLTVSEPGMIAPAAAQLLDAVIGIVKQQTVLRNDLAWQVLEPQLRLFASGAQSSSDVYPAIKYLLSRLGDKQSLLLTPEVAAALHQVGAANAADAANARVTMFVLPDGACLVLSRTPELAVRTAQNLSAVEALP